MFDKTNGSRAEVWHGTAKKTCGGLTKSHLMMNKHGRIVSRKKHASGKKSIKHLEKLGYKAKKGHFMLFHKGHKGSRKMRKMRGGTGAPTEMGMQGTPAGNAMSGTAMPMNNSMMSNGMMSNGMMSNDMMPNSMMSNSMMGGRRSRRMRGGMMSNGMMSNDMMPNSMMGGRRSRRMRGGMTYGGPLSPHSYNGQGVGTSGAALQILATNMS